MLKNRDISEVIQQQREQELQERRMKVELTRAQHERSKMKKDLSVEENKERARRLTEEKKHWLYKSQARRDNELQHARASVRGIQARKVKAQVRILEKLEDKRKQGRLAANEEAELLAVLKQQRESELEKKRQLVLSLHKQELEEFQLVSDRADKMRRQSFQELGVVEEALTAQGKELIRRRMSLPRPILDESIEVGGGSSANSTINEEDGERPGSRLWGSDIADPLDLEIKMHEDSLEEQLDAALERQAACFKAAASLRQKADTLEQSSRDAVLRCYHMYRSFEFQSRSANWVVLHTAIV